MLQCYSKSRQQVDTITDGGTVDTHAVRMEADADAEIACDVVTMVVNTAPVVSGANSLASADVRQGQDVAVARVTCPSTPGANSKATAGSG